MGGNQSTVLHSLKFSHYCEAARWALQIAGEPYEEVSYAPGVHMLLAPTGSKKEVPKGSTKTSLPFLELKDGTSYSDSFQIVNKFVPGQSISEEMQDLLDNKVGPTTRTIVYSYLLCTDKGGEVFQKMLDGCNNGMFQNLVWSIAQV